MEADESLRIDYQQTTELLRSLSDIRFKLLAFVPSIAGAAVAFMGAGHSASELLAVGALGLAATVGVLLYELSNSELYDEVVVRAAALEDKLGLGLFRLVGSRHERGFGLVYGAALAGWTYLVVWGALRALDVGDARTIGVVVAFVVGVAVVVAVEWRLRASTSVS
jgi:hypothetical protein